MDRVLWARENRIPEFQAVARREEIDGELDMLEEGRWTDNLLRHMECVFLLQDMGCVAG